MTAISNPDPFGRTLALVDGDLQLAGGDFAMVSGTDDLLQDLMVMMLTAAGGDIFNLNYGFDLLNALSSPVPPQSVQQIIRLNIVKSLSTDNRIRELKDVVFDDDPRFFGLSPQSDPVARAQARHSFRSWQAIVLLSTVTDTDLSVTLQGPGI
jgi:hypothetical protein